MLQRSNTIKDLKTYLKISEHIKNRQDIITEEDLKHILTDLSDSKNHVSRSYAKKLKEKHH